MCRFRPLNQKELEIGENYCVSLTDDGKTVAAKNQYDNNTPLTFNFDRVFSPTTSQAAVYEASALPIVECVLRGFNGTVLAYGQTSSGKTHSMIGPSVDDPTHRGIIPRMVTTVFQSIEDSSEDLEFTVKVAYCEIYLEKIRDLLDPSRVNLKILEDKARGIYIGDLTEEYVSQDAEVYQLMKLGNSSREVGHTDMNEGSSRSHAIFMLTISQNNLVDFSAKTGKLVLVDLAGSEKASKTNAKGKRFDEAKKINLSLSTLGQVINSLTDGKSTYVPYRDSKLTRVLQDSLGGNSKTCLIVTCSPSVYNEQETLSTLRFGVRAKAIKNKPKINRELTIPELKLLLSQAKEELLTKHARIQALEQLVEELGGTIPTVIGEARADVHTNNEYQSLLAELEHERVRVEEEMENTATAREELATAVTRCEALVHENECLNSKTINLLLTLGDYEDKINDLNDSLESLNNQLKSSDVQLQTISQQNVILEEKIAERDAELATLRTQVERHEDAEVVRSELSDLKKKYAEQSDQLIASSKAQLGQADVEQWQNEKVSLLAELERKNDENAKLQQELAAMQTKFAKLEESKQEADAALRNKMNNLEKNLGQLTVMHTNHLSTINKLKEDKDLLKKKVVRREERLEKLMDQLKKYREENQEYKAKLDQMVSGSRLDIPRAGNRIRKKIKGGHNPRLMGIFAPSSYEVSK